MKDQHDHQPRTSRRRSRRNTRDRRRHHVHRDGGSAANPSTVRTAASTPATSRVYLGTFFDGGDHNYFPKVTAGSYVVEYDFTVGGGMNTWIDANHPHTVPLPSGTYLGQVAGAADPVHTKTFTLTAGTHRITSQSPVLYGPVKVYLDRV